MKGYDYPKTEVSVQDLCEIGLAMDELDGALKDAVRDADPLVKKRVTDIVDFIYKDITDKLRHYV